LNSKTILRTPAGALRAPWRLAFFGAALVVASLVVAVLVVPFAAKFRVPLWLGAPTLSSIVSVVAILGATWLALRWLDRKPWSDVGLDRTAATPKLVVGGFLIGGAAIALPITILILVGWLRLTPVTAAPWGHPIVRMTVLFLPAAFAEELLTRGYLLTVLRDAWNWPVAVAITSIAFGLLHLQNAGADVQSVALVTLAGVFLATIRIVTGSLYAAWSAHFAWNWVMAAVFHASVSGYAFEAPAYRYVDAGPDWATGGVWGPEGGIPAGVFMIGATGLLLLRLRRRGEGKD
jgi:uncharacterized protein